VTPNREQGEGPLRRFLEGGLPAVFSGRSGRAATDTAIRVTLIGVPILLVIARLAGMTVALVVAVALSVVIGMVIRLRS